MNDQEKKAIANKAMAEIIELFNSSLINAAMAGTSYRKARDAGLMNEIVRGALDGNEMAAQTYINVLNRFEQLMHSKLTLEQTLDQLRKEGWHQKVKNLSLQQLEQQHGS